MAVQQYYHKQLQEFFHCHKTTQNSTPRFGSKLPPSSGETANLKARLTKIVTYTHNTT